MGHGVGAAGRQRRARLLAAAAGLALGTAGPIGAPFGSPAAAQAQNATTPFNIPAGPLSGALTSFGQQAGVQVTFLTAISAGKTTAGLSGAATPSQALARILQGTGLTYNFTNATTVTISEPAGATAAIEADGTLVLDTIDVTAASVASDRPFETPGSSNFISAQEIERFPGLSAGAIFQGTPGVISGSSSNGAAVDPNIRGLQGMNRVATTIDGSQQSTSSYRGYQGVDSRTYVDPDLIGGVTITKGPDGPVGGAIAGTVAMETLGVSDILRPGETYGVRVRAGLNSNGVAPVLGASGGGDEQSDTGNGTVSLAGAVTTTGVDLVAAYVRRQNGNYFAGTNGTRTVEDVDGSQKLLSSYGYGQQVYNTSQDVTSALVKATLRPADGHELQLGYMHYGNEFGEVTPGVVNSGNVTHQIPLSTSNVDQVTARYHFKPDDNDLLDFRLNAYASNVDENGYYSVGNDSYPVPQTSFNTGVEATNVSRLDIAATPLTLRYGASFRFEHDDADGAQWRSGSAWANLWVMPAVGQQQVTTVFGRAKWEPLSWLAIEGGLEYLNYSTDFNGEPFYTYTGPTFTGYSGSGVSPSASITVTPLPGWQLYAQYQTGIRPPSVRETSMTRFEQVFNPYLLPEQAQNWEFGTNLLKNDLFLPGDKARLKLSYFNNVTNNYIGRSYSANQMELFNYDAVTFRGFELSGGYDAGWGFLDFGFNYYTDFEACLRSGKCMDYTLEADYLANQIPPRFTASLTAGMRFWEDKITVGGRLTYMGQRLASLVEDPTYFWVTKLWAPYTVVDLFGQWKINESVTLDVGVQNLFDAYYIDALNNTDMPAPGRVVRGTLTAKLGGAEPITWLPFGQPSNARVTPGAMPWTGLHVGGHMGAGFGRVSGTTTLGDGTPSAVAASESADQTLNNILGGVQAGYDVQFANGIVVGVEGDFTWTRLSDGRDTLSAEDTRLIERGMLEARTDYAFDWLSTLRARAGYGADRLFVYGTGGVAFLREVEERTQYRSTSASAALPAGLFTMPFFNETAATTRTGFALGGGAEYAFADNWTIKAEYLFAGFGASDFVFGKARAGVSLPYTVNCVSGRPSPPCAAGASGPLTVPGTSQTIDGRRASNDADLQLLRIGVNYRF